MSPPVCFVCKDAIRDVYDDVEYRHDFRNARKQSRRATILKGHLHAACADDMIEQLRPTKDPNVSQGSLL